MNEQPRLLITVEQLRSAFDVELKIEYWGSIDSEWFEPLSIDDAGSHHAAFHELLGRVVDVLNAPQSRLEPKIHLDVAETFVYTVRGRKRKHNSRTACGLSYLSKVNIVSDRTEVTCKACLRTKAMP